MSEMWRFQLSKGILNMKNSCPSAGLVNMLERRKEKVRRIWYLLMHEKRTTSTPVLLLLELNVILVFTLGSEEHTRLTFFWREAMGLRWMTEFIMDKDGGAPPSPPL